MMILKMVAKYRRNDAVFISLPSCSHWINCDALSPAEAGSSGARYEIYVTANSGAIFSYSGATTKTTGGFDALSCLSYLGLHDMPIMMPHPCSVPGSSKMPCFITNSRS